MPQKNPRYFEILSPWMIRRFGRRLKRVGKKCYITEANARKTLDKATIGRMERAGGLKEITVAVAEKVGLDTSASLPPGIGARMGVNPKPVVDEAPADDAAKGDDAPKVDDAAETAKPKAKPKTKAKSRLRRDLQPKASTKKKSKKKPQTALAAEGAEGAENR